VCSSPSSSATFSASANAGWIAAQQLDVVRHVVLVGLEADAARLDALGRQVEAELAQLIGRRSGSESVKEGDRYRAPKSS